MHDRETAAPHVSELRNPLTLTAAAVTTVSAVLFVAFLLLDFFGWAGHSNPYTGILLFILVPAVFVLGLLLMPLGVWRERRRRMRGLPPSLRHWPRIDFNDSRTRAVCFAIVVLTPVNLVLVSSATYKGVEAMDSVAFCGQVCHQVMEPEFVAHANGPHARVKCVECHIGPGASWFVQSKLSGARQVFAVMANTHSRPITSPVHNLRPARETCEQCHWPTQFHGDKLETRREFAEDEGNTESVTTLRLRIGGVDGQGRPSGIHWHVAEQNAIEYIALDAARQSIGWVKLTSADGTATEYLADGVTPQQLAGGERRRMDCIDCHNRPSHIFARSAERAVNDAMASGSVAKDLPYVRREAVKILTSTFSDRAAADAEIPARLAGFYRTTYPALWTSRQQDVEQSARALRSLHQRNVFPAMKLTWGFHADNRGHMEFPGCFRCHDDSHRSKDGKVIRQDCEMCHEIS